MTVKAECNYWGATGPKATKFSGAVDYDPYRTTDPLPGMAPPAEDNDPGDAFPLTYDLSYNYPNPFNPTTRIKYDVPAPGGQVSVSIYDITGRRVRALVSAHRGPGIHTAFWDGKDDRGSPAASGIYFVRMKANMFSKTRKIVLMK